ncbi:MAG: hypothetical protein KatS3mg115_0818 [Candidatus Poribacteria bacterium]|nr:MAG: hypothetical protein KatS3mg115_0818 [Candidatus Poribacteria bacterium]
MDWRQRGEAIGFYQLAPALLLSLGVQLRWNDSNAAFYDFWLLELWGGVFWSDSEGRSLLLEIGGGAVQFRGRPITPEGHRRDRSWRLLASAELPLGVGWSVHPRLRWVRNRTNESRTALEFLNFDQTIVELQIEWRWGAAEKSPEGRSLREGLRAFVFPEGEGKGTIQAERREQLRR